jgi:hypothetical protein
MWRHEANSLKPIDFAHLAQQFGERSLIAKFDAIGIYILAKQSDFNDPLIDERPNFGQDICLRAIFIYPSQRWNYAEGAGVIAPHRN